MAFLLVLALGSFRMKEPTLGTGIALLPAYLGLTFFLFCNVFRVGNRLEIFWCVPFLPYTRFQEHEGARETLQYEIWGWVEQYDLITVSKTPDGRHLGIRASVHRPTWSWRRAFSAAATASQERGHCPPGPREPFVPSSSSG